MKIENNQAIEAADFALIEKHYSCPLSVEIRNFLEKYNGDIVSPEYGLEITYTTDKERSIEDYFPTVNHTQEIIRQLPFIDYIEGFLDESNWGEDEVDADKLLPLMAVLGGSVNLYITVSGPLESKLFVVDNGDYGVSKVNFTLAELVNNLES